MSYPTFTEYAASMGVTPHSPYADIMDALQDWYESRRPWASLEDIEEWVSRHASRWAGPLLD